MNRLQYFLHAKTQFNLHSPFVYRLYTEVLFSRAKGTPHGRFAEVVWRLERHYNIASEHLDDTAVLDTSDGRFLVVNRPHRDEQRWQSIIADPQWQVTIDLFSVGLAVENPRLHKQHFILR